MVVLFVFVALLHKMQIKEGSSGQIFREIFSQRSGS